MEQRQLSFQALIGVARDLTASLGASDRYARLLEAVRRVIPCDAACLLRLEGRELVPMAAHGLLPDVLGHRFALGSHPRLDAILASEGPVRFPAASDLPDPFDGLVPAEPNMSDRVHDCMGCRLVFDGQVVGALTADALAASAFDAVDMRLFETLGVLAGAAMRTNALIEALERTAARRGEIARALQHSATLARGGEILGVSPAARRLLEEIRTVAGSDLAVLITGETGTGKELAARAIHAASRRSEEALIEVNCAALPESIAESELFGHVAGSFTGATRDRAGKFEIASGGTLFLDEVGELPLALQPKLLRALQQGEIQRVGSDRRLRVDVRILAATNRDLEKEVAAGRFRADLYHRLAVYPVHVPPLRERVEDIPLLAASFLDAGRRRLGLGPTRLGETARARLAAFDWPGNVRELENVVSRALLRAARQTPPGTGAPVVIGEENLDLAPAGRGERGGSALAGAGAGGAGGVVTGSREPANADPGLPLAERIDQFRRREIAAAVERHQGNWSAAARELGIHRSNLHHLARRLGLI